MLSNKCPECGSRNISFETAKSEIICVDCGLVLEDNRIESDPYISESTKAHATLPALATAGSKGMQGKIYKDPWLLSTKEKNTRIGTAKITALAERLHLPDYVQKDAKIIFKQVMDLDLAIGRDTITFSYASIYASCNIHSLPKTPLELVDHTIKKKNLLRAYKLIRQKLKLNIQVMDPLDLVPRFSSRLSLNAETVTRANEMIVEIQTKRTLTGKRPETIVAAVLYLAAKETGTKVTQRQVANALGVIEVTIRKTIKSIRN